LGEFYVHLISPGGVERAGYSNDVQDVNYNTFTTVAPLNGVVEVAPRPVIIGQPQSQVVVVGNPVTFTVTAVGSLPLAYQWRFNSAAIASATNSTFGFASVQMTNGGNYTVVVSNTQGAVTSATATLTVLKATPTLTWTNPAAIRYGMALGAVQLNATASVPGTFAYTPGCMGLSSFPCAGSASSHGSGGLSLGLSRFARECWVAWHGRLNSPVRAAPRFPP
jgi:hypothetical protein